MNNPDNAELAIAIENFEAALDTFGMESSGTEYNEQPFWTTEAGNNLNEAIKSLSLALETVERGL